MQNCPKPQVYNDLVFGDEESASLLRALLNDIISFPAYGKTGLLLYGAFGTGKTVSAEILCNEIEQSVYGDTLSTPPYWIDCDNQRDITEIIKSANNARAFISFNRSGLHYYVFDEVDNLTAAGQKKLKLFLNNPDVVAVLTTNYLQEVDDGVRDRCYVLNCNTPLPENMLPRLKSILRQHSLPIPSDDAILEKVEAVEGSWRNVIPAVIVLANSF